MLLPVSLPLLELLGVNVRGLGSRLRRTGLCARHNHPQLGHHEVVLDLVNPEAIVGAIQLGNLVQISLRHEESDGWVRGRVDGLGLG